MQLLRPKKRHAFTTRAPEVNIRKQLVYGTLSLIVVGGILSGIWYGTRLPFVTIASVQAEGGETIPKSDVEKRINDALEGNYLFIIPKRFTLLYPKDDVAAAVSGVPRTKDVSVMRDGTTLSVTYNERAPYALWCTDDASAECMFLDENGYAFAKAPALRGSSFVRLITSGNEPTENSQPFTGDAIAGIYTFIDALEVQFDFRVLSVTETEDKDLFYTLSNGGSLYTSPEASPETIFENLATVLASDDFKHLTSDTFSYIDLRFGNRVFVNEEGVPTPTEPDTSLDEPQYAKEPENEVDDGTGVMLMSTEAEGDIAPEVDESLPEEE